MSNSINMRHRRKLAIETFKDRGSRGDCFRPSCEASVADLAEYHKENMGLRRAHQLARQPNVGHAINHSIATGKKNGESHLHEREIARRTK